MISLIERIEKAEAGSRELDADILAAVDKAEYWRYRHDLLDAPNYTTSVDAALTLIPNDFGFKIEHPAQNLKEFGIPAVSIGSAVVFYLGEDVRIKEIACANTVPLAICAAALRAREVQ